MSYELSAQIEKYIFIVRNKPVMLDNSISLLFNVPVKRINEQIKRNIDRFPDEFSFQLNLEEWTTLKSQIATSKKSRGGKVKPPRVLTEHGVAMIATLLNSPQAIALSVVIIKVFVQSRNSFFKNQFIENQLELIRLTQKEHSKEIAMIWEHLGSKSISKTHGIFFNDQYRGFGI
jgi:hypothetical protein